MTDLHATCRWLPSLALVGALLLTGSLGATPPSEADPALLAVEVPHVDLTAGQEFQVLGRFQELVGTRLLLVGCPVPIELDTEADWRALRSPDLRRQLLSIRARVSDGDPLRLEAVTVETGPAAAEVFARRRARLGELERPRQIAVACWAIQFGRELEEQELMDHGRETLLGVLEKALANASPGPGVSHWLETGQRLLGNDPRWRSAVVKFRD